MGFIYIYMRERERERERERDVEIIFMITTKNYEQKVKSRITSDRLVFG